MKKRISIFVLALLLPAIAYAAVTGLPTKARFLGLTVENQPSLMGAISYYTGLKIRQNPTTIGAGYGNTMPAFWYALDDDDGAGLVAYLDSNKHAALGFWTDHWGTDQCAVGSDPGCQAGRGGWYANNNCAFILQSESDNSAIGKFSLYGNTSGTCNASGGGYFDKVELLKIDNFVAVPTLTMNGNIALTGTSSSSKACATNYARIGPNYCAWAGYGLAMPVSTSTGTSCQQSAALTGVTDAKGLLLKSVISAKAQNAVGLVSQTGYTYANADSGCASVGMTTSVSVYEFVATAGAVTIGSEHGAIVIPATTTGRYRFNSLAATTVGDVSFHVMGYFD